MNTKFKFSLTLLCGTIFFLGCNNASNSVDMKDKDSAKVKSKKNDTADKKLNIGTIKSDDSMKIAINNMTNKINRIKLQRNVDIDFAHIIIECHGGAVDMSLQEVKSGTDAGMKALAKELMRNQMDEQSKFGTLAKDIMPSKKYMGNVDELSEEISTMKSNLNALKMTQNIDKDYANLMIKHHESEIEMAKYELSHGMNIQLKQMSQKIINRQSKEIGLFKNWLSLSE